MTILFMFVVCLQEKHECATFDLRHYHWLSKMRKVSLILLAIIIMLLIQNQAYFTGYLLCLEFIYIEYFEERNNPKNLRS